MKIATLLTDFLYQHRYLNIPGIGYFYIDKDIVIPDPDDKEFEDFLRQIQYKDKPLKDMDEALINFIRAKTGKIKPLAIADLDSFLSDCKLFINIGKPIFLPGIGTLSKGNQGKMDFIPGAPASEKVEYRMPQKATEKARTEQKKKPAGGVTRKFVLKQPNKRELVLFSGIAGALLLIILGGVILFNYAGKPKEKAEEFVSVAPPVTDTVARQLPPPAATDSVEKAPAVVSATPVTKKDTAAKAGLKAYKFVLQRTSKREIAENNYRNIKLDRPDLKMETRDSVTYKIFVIQKCTPADTARQKEILNYWYWGKNEMKIYIER